MSYDTASLSIKADTKLFQQLQFIRGRLLAFAQLKESLEHAPNKESQFATIIDQNIRMLIIRI